MSEVSQQREAILEKAEILVAKTGDAFREVVQLLFQIVKYLESERRELREEINQLKKMLEVPD